MTPVKILLNLEKEKAKENPELEWMDHDYLRAAAFAVKRILEEKDLSEKEKELAAARPVFNLMAMKTILESSNPKDREAIGEKGKGNIPTEVAIVRFQKNGRTPSHRAEIFFYNLENALQPAPDRIYSNLTMPPLFPYPHLKRERGYDKTSDARAYKETVKATQEGARTIEIQDKIKDPELSRAIMWLEQVRAYRKIVRGLYAIPESLPTRILEITGGNEIGVQANTVSARKYLERWEKLRKNILEKISKGEPLTEDDKKTVLKLKESLHKAGVMPFNVMFGSKQLKHIQKAIIETSPFYTPKGTPLEELDFKESIEGYIRWIKDEKLGLRAYIKDKNGKVSWEDIGNERVDAVKKAIYIELFRQLMRLPPSKPIEDTENIDFKKIDKRIEETVLKPYREYAKKVLEEMKKYAK